LKTNRIINSIIDEVATADDVDRIKVWGVLATYALESMTDIVTTAIDLSSNQHDNQKSVLVLNKCIENSKESYYNVTTAKDDLENRIMHMRTLKEQNIEKIKQFLQLCGMGEKLCDDDKSAALQDIHVGEQKTYASAIGSCPPSELVVEKQPPNIIHQTTSKILMVDTGFVDILAPTVTTDAEAMHFTITYMEPKNIFVMRMGSSVYTLGPGDFINLKLTQGKTRHAKRCLNPHPCRFKNCKYYHDPMVVKKDYNPHRNFAISYIEQMMAEIKDTATILESNVVRNEDFIRDLVQLAGIIMIKAAQIKALPPWG
jgi:hypothetical protein